MMPRKHAQDDGLQQKATTTKEAEDIFQEISNELERGNLEIDVTEPLKLSAKITPKSKWHFTISVMGVFVFFGLHNYLQEAIMSFPEFKYGWFLGFLEVLGTMVCCHIERIAVGDRRPMTHAASYIAVVACLLGSSSLSNISLNYINYPTKVVFRSCKLIPTMVAALVMNNRRVSPAEFLAGGAVCVGLICFGWADAEVSPNFHLGGYTLVSLSVLCDSILPNLQDQLFARGCTRLEQVYFTNVLTFCALTVLLGLSGDLKGAILAALHDYNLLACMLIYTFVAYVAISCHMNVVCRYGAITAVLVGNARKAMTICLSFVIFPKPFTMNYFFGAVLVFGGLVASAMAKEKSKQIVSPKWKEMSPNNEAHRA